MYGIAAKLLKELVSGRKVSATVCPYKNVTCSSEHTAKAATKKELQEIKGQEFVQCFQENKLFNPPLLVGQPVRGCLWLRKRCGWVCSMSPMMLVVRRAVGLESVVLWNHGKKVCQATEEGVRELAGDCMGSDVAQNLVTGAATEVSAWISLQF